MNFAGLTILVIISCLILGGSRRSALLGMIGGILYLTQVQQLNLGGFNLYAFRLIELAGFLRVISRHEFSFSTLQRIDKVLLTFIIYTTVVYALRTREDLFYRIGAAVDAFLCYFAFRGLIANRSDFRWLLKILVVLLIPYAALNLYETYTRHNPFAFIGGRTGGADMMRAGRMRAAGTFRHASLLGTLGATFFPVYVAVVLPRGRRILALFGIGACLAIVWASNSGGPLSCAMVAAVGWLLWPLRMRMSVVRRGIVLALVALGLVMKAPIWYLIAKVSSVTGGDGYHRSKLMEQGFNHLGGWWLAGMPIEATQHWFAYYMHSTGGADITNQFLSYGIAAGIGSMGLFIFLLVQAFRSLGSEQQACRERSGADQETEYLLWGLGVMLVVHIFNWIGITYFDQMYAVWYAQLAAIVACTLPHQSETLQSQTDAGSA